MKIVYISNSTIPSKTANSIHVMKMCQAFAENGNQVTLLAPHRKKSYEKGINDIYEYYGVKKNFVIKKLWYPEIKGGALFYTFAIFFYLINNFKFNLAYGRFLYGCFVASLLRIKVIYESHAPIYEETKYGLIIFKFLLKSKFFKKLVVISESLKNIYIKKSYLNHTKIQVAHDGADEVIDFQTKKNLLGNKNNLKVGYVGHLHKGKGMEIISLIVENIDIDCEFHVIGGLKKDINFWKNKINRENIFFYGHVSHKEVSAYINALDICLLPNQEIVLGFGSENVGMNLSNFTSPLKLFEYMSHKKAIIASDLSVLREILNENNSVLVKPDNVKEWIKAIENLKYMKNRDIIASQALMDFRMYTWKKRAKKVI